MRTKFLTLTVFTFLLLLSCESTSLDEPIQIEESVTLSKTPSVNNSYVIISSSNKLPNGIKKSISSINGSISNSIPEIGIAVAHSEDPDFISNASKLEGIQSVIPNYEIQWIDPEMQIEMIEVSSINPPYTGDDDFVFDLQWGHDAIDAPEAWETGARGKGVMVFVLDSGIDAEHLDISPNLNSELSKSFVPGEDWNVRDEPVFNHGTHVAGTIAGADNGWGMIGVAPEATIVAVKVLSEYNGSGLFSWIIEGIIYASDSGADIINMSLGGLNLKRFGRNVAHVKNAINRATTYAYQNGVTVIAAAGNDGFNRNHLKDEEGNPYMDLIVMPADGPNVVQVSATAPIGWALDPGNTFMDTPTFYTNYGSMIDFSAPGGTWEFAFKPGGQDLYTIAGLTRPGYAFDMVWSASPGGWAAAAGTSMAAPHVAGVAALIIGENGGSMAPSKVISALKRSAEQPGKSGKDPHYGHGRVNAYKAVTQ